MPMMLHIERRWIEEPRRKRAKHGHLLRIYLTVAAHGIGRRIHDARDRVEGAIRPLRVLLDLDDEPTVRFDAEDVDIDRSGIRGQGRVRGIARPIVVPRRGATGEFYRRIGVVAIVLYAHAE